MEENNSAQTVQEPQPQFVPHTFIAQNVPEQNQTTDNKPKTNYLLIILVIVFVNIAFIGTLAFLILPAKNVKNVPKTITSNTNNPLPENSASNNSQTISNITESTIAPSPKPTTTSLSQYVPTLIETKDWAIRINLSKEWQKDNSGEIPSGWVGSPVRFLKKNLYNSTSHAILIVSSYDYSNNLKVSNKDLNKKEDKEYFSQLIKNSLIKGYSDKNNVTIKDYTKIDGVTAYELTIKPKIKDGTITKLFDFIKGSNNYEISITALEEESEKEWGEFEKNSLNTIEFIN